MLLNLGSTDVHARKSRKSDPDYRKLRRALCVGYGNQLAERMLHHNGYLLAIGPNLYRYVIV